MSSSWSVTKKCCANAEKRRGTLVGPLKVPQTIMKCTFATNRAQWMPFLKQNVPDCNVFPSSTNNVSKATIMVCVCASTNDQKMWCVSSFFPFSRMPFHVHFQLNHRKLFHCRIREVADKLNKYGSHTFPALNQIKVQVKQVVVGPSHLGILLEDGRALRVAYSVITERLDLSKPEKTK